MLHFQTDDFFKTKTCGKQEDYLARDLQVFSNIEVWNIPFALTVAGFTCFPQWGVPNRGLRLQADSIQ